MRTRSSFCRAAIIVQIALALHGVPASEAHARDVSGAALVSPAQVAHAMCQSGFMTSVGDVELLSAVRTRHPNGTLKVISVGRWKTGTGDSDVRVS
jgi:hypothetical protein